MKDFIKESHVTGEQSQNLSRFEPVGGGGRSHTAHNGELQLIVELSERLLDHC